MYFNPLHDLFINLFVGGSIGLVNRVLCHFKTREDSVANAQRMNLEFLWQNVSIMPQTDSVCCSLTTVTATLRNFFFAPVYGI